MSTELGREIAAQAWCKPTTEKIEMIPELAEAFAEIIAEITDTDIISSWSSHF